MIQFDSTPRALCDMILILNNASPSIFNYYIFIRNYRDLILLMQPRFGERNRPTTLGGWLNP